MSQLFKNNDRFTPIKYIKVDDREDGDSINNKVKVENHVPLNSNNEAYKSGKYEVIYSATDEGGASSTYTLTVIVNEPPVITASNRTFFKGQNVDAQELLRKAIAKDKEDGDITNKLKIVQIDYNGTVDKNVTSLNTDSLGLFDIEYTVTDNYKKTVTGNAKIRVIENQSVINSQNSGAIRFINNEYVDTLNPASIWNDEDYKDVLLKSFNNKQPEQYSKTKITSIREAEQKETASFFH